MACPPHEDGHSHRGMKKELRSSLVRVSAKDALFQIWLTIQPEAKDGRPRVSESATSAAFLLHHQACENL